MPLWNKICPNFPDPPSGKTLYDCLQMLRMELFHRKQNESVMAGSDTGSGAGSDGGSDAGSDAEEDGTGLNDSFTSDGTADDDALVREEDEEEDPLLQQLLPSNNHLLIHHENFVENAGWELFLPNGYFAFKYLYVLAENPYKHWSCVNSADIISVDLEEDRKGEDR